MARLLQRIDRQLAETSDPARRGELLAEQACYFARIGLFAQAQRNIDLLRNSFAAGAEARISILIMLAEGLLLYYEKFDQSSVDRIVRANALSVAAGVKDLIQLTASWLAHMDFNRSNFESMERALEKCKPLSGGPRSAAQARAQTVIANSYAYCGERTKARHWYSQARDSALELGDEALIEAIIFNRASFSFSRYRVESLDIGADDEKLRFLDIEITSAQSYFSGTKHKSLAQMLEACSARMDFFRRRYGEAEAKFSAILKRGEQSAFLSDHALLRAEQAQCLIALGQVDSARELTSSLISEPFESMGLDDQVIFTAAMGELARSTGNEQLADRFAEARLIAEEKYKRETTSALEMLDRVLNERSE